MKDAMEKILIVSPRDIKRAAALGMPFAHLCYSLSAEGNLTRHAQGPATRGGHMVLTAEHGRGNGLKAEKLFGEVLRECSAMDYRGILCDFTGSPDSGLIEFARTLASRGPSAMPRRRYEVYLPEIYADAVPEGRVLIPSSLSGGSLALRLSEASSRYGGSERVALLCEVMRHIFTLPDPDGVGRELNRAELSALITKHRAMPQFSRELCAHYFTCREDPGGHNFVLFDDAHSIGRKCEIALEQGVHTAFLLYAEIADLGV